VGADASTSYSILSTYVVQESSLAQYAIRGAVASDNPASYGVVGTVQQDATTVFQILPTISIYDTADRGTLDLTGCSVVPNGTTPTINIKNQYSWEENASGARNCFFHVTGMTGMRPVFDVDRSNMELANYTGKFKWSYTGERGTWNDFTTTTRQTSPNVYRSQHADAFTQDLVYVSMANPWRVGYTLPWLQSLESSGLIGPAPSGSGSYQFETRSATTDHQGNPIAAQPLLSFKISNGNPLAPDGNPKRILVLMSGVHAAEDVGMYALKGAVEFLLSPDPMAVSVRDWFDAVGYPGVAQAGRAGGAQRGDFQTSYKSADVNRAWDGAPVLETITKHKAAVLTDVGSGVHIFMDFHGDHTTTENTSFFEGSAGDPYGAKWDAAIDAHQVTTIIYSSSTEYSASWFKSNKSCPYSLTPESSYLGEWTPANKEAFGAAHIKAISTLIAQGEWGLPIVQSDSTASYSVISTVGRDAEASYNVLATSQVSASSAADYVVVGAVAADSAAAYQVRQAVLSEGSTAYAVRTSALAEGLSSYAVRTLADADALSVYQVLSANAVTVSALASYLVRGLITVDQLTQFNLAGIVLRDVSALYSILPDAGALISDPLYVAALPERTLTASLAPRVFTMTFPRS